MEFDFLLQLLLDILDGSHVVGALRVELLDLQRQLIDDAPSNEVLAGEPGLSFCVCGFSEEDGKVEEVAEFVGLVDAHVDAGLLALVVLLVDFEVRV